MTAPTMMNPRLNRPSIRLPRQFDDRKAWVTSLSHSDSFQGVAKDPQSFHKYAYVHGDPVNNVDPTGESLVSRIAVVGLVGTLIGISVPAIIRSRTIAQNQIDTTKSLSQLTLSSNTYAQRIRQLFLDHEIEFVQSAIQANPDANIVEFRKAAELLAIAMVEGTTDFLRTHTAGFANGERSPWLYTRYNNPWCADFCEFFAGGYDESGAFVDPYFHDVFRNERLIQKYFDFGDAQRHFTTQADLPQHNFTVFYPRGYSPTLSNGQPIPFNSVVPDPNNPNQPLVSNDPLLFIFDPWFRLLPDVATADDLLGLQAIDPNAPEFVAPSNFGDVNL